LIAYSIVVFDEDTAIPGLPALIPTMGAGLIILFASPRSLVGRLLGSRVLVGIGLISYSAYLWHQPLFAFARLGRAAPLDTSLVLILAASSFPLAYLSWRYVEQPFRRPNTISHRSLAVFAVGASVFFVLVGFLGQKTDGYEKIYFDTRLNPAEQEMFMLIKKHTGATLQNLYRGMGDDGDCNFWTKTVDAEFTARFKSCSEKYGKAVVVLGDSHAMNIYNALYQAQMSDFLVSVSKAGCRPHKYYETCHYDGFDQFMSENAEAVYTIIFNQAGVHFLSARGKSVNAAALSVELDTVNVAKVANYLDSLARHSAVIWLGPFVETGYDFRDVRYVVAQGLKIDQRAIDVYEQLDNKLEDYFAANSQEFNYISLINILQITPNFLIIGDCLTYRNEDHFSICGEKIIGKMIKQAFRRTHD
jgi:hypothetical protein